MLSICKLGSSSANLHQSIFINQSSSIIEALSNYAKIVFQFKTVSNWGMVHWAKYSKYAYGEIDIAFLLR